jgi:hypothetical protein
MAKNTKTENTEIQTQGTQAMAIDYGEDAVDVGQVAPGYENHTNEDTAIPFIYLLQSNSPVVAEGKVPGAAAGNWYNSVTGDLFKNPDGLLFVAAATRHEFLRYTPREKGGGFKGRYAIDSAEVAKAKAESKKFGEYFFDGDPEGDELSETFTVFGAVCTPEGALGMAVVPFKGTGIKCYKNWMTQVRAQTVIINGQKKVPPLYCHFARLTTEFKKNNEGTFWVPKYEPALGTVTKSMLAPTDERFQMAKAVKMLLDMGTAKVDYSQAQGGGREDNDSATPNGAAPF